MEVSTVPVPKEGDGASPGGQGLGAAGHSQQHPALLQDLASFQSPVSMNQTGTCRQQEHTHTASSIAHEKVHVINRQTAFLSCGKERIAVWGGNIFLGLSPASRFLQDCSQ